MLRELRCWLIATVPMFVFFAVFMYVYFYQGKSLNADSVFFVAFMALISMIISFAIYGIIRRREVSSKDCNGYEN